MKNFTSILDSRKDEVLKMYYEGANQSELASFFGVGTSALSKFFQANGLQYLTVQQRKIEQNREQIIQWYKEGKSQNWIAKQIGINENTLRDNLERFDINPIILKEQGLYEKDKVIYEHFDDIILAIIGNEDKAITAQKIGLDLKEFELALIRNGIIYKDRKKRRSKGENLIADILRQNGIRFSEQYSFADCRFPDTNRVAYFDFAVLNEDNNVEYLIEYDGGQHYYAVDHFGGEDTLIKNQEHDYLKNEYCLNKGIPLIRIPYTKTDISINDLCLDSSLFIIY